MNDDFGPAIGGARRDPALSIRRQLESPRQPRARRKISTGWATQLLFAVLVLTATAGALVLLGGLLHVVWNVIMIGWQLL